MSKKDRDYYVQRIDEALFESDLDADANAEIEDVLISDGKVVCRVRLNGSPKSIEQLFKFAAETQTELGIGSKFLYHLNDNVLEVNLQS